jgi:hypothetical protein
MWFFRSFSQKNEKNNRATMVSVKLISVALSVTQYQLKYVLSAYKHLPG